MPAKPNELAITRVYDAPVKLVWDAWTDLKQVAQWWGPRGFTITTKSKDFKPGGKWIYTMHGPDGRDYPNITTYHEIVKHEKMVYDHGGNEDRPKLFTVTVTFQEDKGKTTMNMTMAFDTEEVAKQMKGFIKQAGGNSTWDRLGEYLENETAGKDTFMINRSFPTDMKTMRDMWTNPDLLAQWMGPTGCTMSFLKADLHEGKTSLWSMTMDGETKYGQLHYKKISPTQLVYTQNFCDKEGKLCKHPYLTDPYPDVLLTTVTLTEEGPKETRVSVKWDIHCEATEADRKTFHEIKPMTTAGWTGSFDKLEALLV